MKLLRILDAVGLALENFIDTLGKRAQGEEREEKRENDMCGSLKHSHWANKAPIKVGQSFPRGTLVEVTKDGTTTAVSGEIVWNGFARDDTLEKWKAGGWVPARLHVDGYTEGEQDFMVPKGHVIQALVLEKAKTHLNIVTREAETDEEKAVHSRWPETTPKVEQKQES